MITRNKEQGFTIIEVVLVLAIAGLIFLMVFIALPTLQKNQRDTTRRNDVSRFKAQVNQFQANNKGVVPTDAQVLDATASGFPAKYLGSLNSGWVDPLSGNTYGFKAFTTSVAATLIATDPAGTWTYKAGQKCNGEDFTASGGTATRTYAVAMKLEGSGVSCMDNQ